MLCHLPCCPPIRPSSGVVTAPDRCYTPATPTRSAVAKEKPGDRIFCQVSLRGLAHLACHILSDIFSKKTLDILGDVLAPNYKALVTIDRSLRTQLGHEEGKYMLRRTSHHLANFLVVDPKCLLRSNPVPQLTSWRSFILFA